jgi:hypothetical protein
MATNVTINNFWLIIFSYVRRPALDCRFYPHQHITPVFDIHSRHKCSRCKRNLVFVLWLLNTPSCTVIKYLISVYFLITNIPNSPSSTQLPIYSTILKSKITANYGINFFKKLLLSCNELHPNCTLIQRYVSLKYSIIFYYRYMFG